MECNIFVVDDLLLKSAFLPMNKFGGDWTKLKIEMLVEYARAYLTIMNQYPRFSLIYFDGFAGTGFIEREKDGDTQIIVGAARRIIELEHPNTDGKARTFDLYYFVEKDKGKAQKLEENIKDLVAIGKRALVVKDDCNIRLKSLAEYLRRPENKYQRVLVYIDPFGMQLEWDSIEKLKGLGVDMWILVPTGIGVNRMLRKDGQIDDTWLTRLEKFLGMKKDEILDHFYQPSVGLFPDLLDKEAEAGKKAGELYRKRLQTVFKHVSPGHEIRNANNSLMFHFLLASNNSAGLRIASDIIRKYTDQTE